ncbi:unnamed protein product, partial [Pylaiella littoralis]
RVCNECLRDLARDTMPNAALAYGLWVEDFPEHLRDSTWLKWLHQARPNQQHCFHFGAV